MKEKVKTGKCIECGGVFPLELLSRRWLCADCGIKRMLSAAKQIREKVGPIYEVYARNKSLALLRRHSNKGVPSE